MAALMLVSPTEATTEAKTTHVRTNAIPCTTEDHKLFKTIWIHTSRHIAKRRQENLEWQGVTRSVTSDTIAAL